uniref:Uncharacterized protein n=1 Tax=Strigamia maritima TaxID=126957 RepID=T1JHQ9_STRMM
RRKETRVESQDDFEALANVYFSQSQEINAKKNDRMDSDDVQHQKYKTWFKEKTWEKLNVRQGSNKMSPCSSTGPKDSAKDFSRGEPPEGNSIFTKYFVEKIIGMTTRFSDLEKRFGNIESTLNIKLDKMEKILICGQEIVDRRMLEIESTLTQKIIQEIETAVTQKIIEEIDGKLRKMYESLHKRQKKCIDKQNALNEKLNENSENNNMDNKLQRLESSIKTLLENITASFLKLKFGEIHKLSLAEKFQRHMEFEPKKIIPQNSVVNLKPQNQVLLNQFSHLPSPAVSKLGF